MADFVIPTNQREFRCKHCDGKILIPKDLPPTTGPCPHCAGIITSPTDDATAAPVADFQVPPRAAVVKVPVALEKPSPAPQQSAVKAEPPAMPQSPAPAQESPAIPKTVNIEAPPKIELPAKREVSERNKPKKHSTANTAKPHRSGLVPAMLVLLALVMAGGAVVYFAAKELGRNSAPLKINTTAGDPAVNEANYIRIGWQKEAYPLLRGFMEATDTKGKLPFILNGPELAPRLEEFYGSGRIVDSDTPAEAFSIYELSEEDHKRGLFMMVYDQPPQLEMKEFFRPLASLEVQYGVDEADLLLSTLSSPGNFEMEPLRVHAFFKRTPEGLKLDWETFVQTKYRTLQNFVELPESGRSGIFRVIIVEDVPEKGRAVAGTRTYRVVDPANTTDSARVNVNVDSDTGRTLSPINWRGTKENRPITRTATVELKWSGEPSSPELEISRFICWEFLGLGGQETPATASTK